jgi:hypothetical protein
MFALAMAIFSAARRGEQSPAVWIEDAGVSHWGRVRQAAPCRTAFFARGSF